MFLSTFSTQIIVAIALAANAGAAILARQGMVSGPPALVTIPASGVTTSRVGAAAAAPSPFLTTHAGAGIAGSPVSGLSLVML